MFGYTEVVWDRYTDVRRILRHFKVIKFKIEKEGNTSTISLVTNIPRRQIGSLLNSSHLSWALAGGDLLPMHERILLYERQS